MSLKIRKYYLRNLSKKFKSKKINDLMYEIKVPNTYFIIFKLLQLVIFQDVLMIMKQLYLKRI